MKHIPKKNVILKTQDTSENNNYNETVIFRLYFKVIVRQKTLFCLMNDF